MLTRLMNRAKTKSDLTDTIWAFGVPSYQKLVHVAKLWKAREAPGQI